MKHVHLQKTPEEIENIKKDQETKIQSIEKKLYNYITMQPPEPSLTHEKNLFEVKLLSIIFQFTNLNVSRHKFGIIIYI